MLFMYGTAFAFPAASRLRCFACLDRAGGGREFIQTEESMFVVWLGLGLAVFAAFALMTVGCEKI